MHQFDSPLMCLPARKSSSTVGTSKLGGKSVAFFTIGRCVLVAVTAIHLIVDQTSEFQFQLARTKLQVIGESEQGDLVGLVHLDLNRLVL